MAIHICVFTAFSLVPKQLDAQVLLDRFEEQFDLPALPLQVSNQFRLQGEIVGQKHQAFAGVVFNHHAAQDRGVILARIMHRQHTSLIAPHRRIDPIHRMRVTPLELGIAFGAGG